jgi:hypothetical protein
VCPNDEKLLDRLRAKNLVVRVSSIDNMQAAYDRAREENGVLCMIVEENRALTDVPLRDEWKAIPLALHVPRMGDLKRVLRHPQQWRERNIRVFLPAESADNLIHLRILSSVGIPAGLILHGRLDWDAVNDLMHYAMYTRVPRPNLDPFGYVRLTYNPREFTYINTPLFENPLKYVHIDSEGNLALSASDLRNGKWIGRGLECLTSLSSSQKYKDGLNAWQGIFLEDRKCAYCPAWRLCMGAFSDECDSDKNVSRFFEDFSAAADSLYESRQSGEKWQP